MGIPYLGCISSCWASASMGCLLEGSVIYGIVTSFLLWPTLVLYLPSSMASGFKKTKRPLVAAIGLYLFFKAMPDQSKNYYSLLEVDISANKQEINAGYRNASRKYHPDKNQDMEGIEEIFIRLKKGQEILLSDNARSIYNRFGDMKNASNEEIQKLSILAIVLSFVTHLMCFTIGFLLTFPHHTQFARQVFVVWSMSIFCVELQLRFVEDEDSFNFLPYVNTLLPFEKIQFFRSLFPCMLVLSMSISAWCLDDRRAYHQALVLRGILSTNRVLTERTEELIRGTSYLKTLLCSPSTAAIKAQLAAAPIVQSASLRAKTSGKKTALENKLTVDDEAAAEDWESFSNVLTDDQREQFKRIVAQHYRKAENDAEQQASRSRRFDVNWGQVLLWVSVFYVWLYYK